MAKIRRVSAHLVAGIVENVSAVEDGRVTLGDHSRVGMTIRPNAADRYPALELPIAYR